MSQSASRRVYLLGGTQFAAEGHPARRGTDRLQEFSPLLMLLHSKGSFERCASV